MTAWHIKAFEDLYPGMLYALLAARQRVFVVEQRNAFLDLDGFDRESLHLWTGNMTHGINAYCRIIPPGVRYSETSLGRVLVVPEHRHSGLGKALVEAALGFAWDMWRSSPVRIGAAADHLEFYESLGFKSTHRRFQEDGILLTTMQAENPEIA
jgi:ElaA protein